MADIGSVPGLDKGLLSQYARVTAVVSPTQCRISLAGSGDNFFAGYYAAVVRKADGTVTAPHGEQVLIGAYQSRDGLLTHAAFRASLAVGDELLLLYQKIITGGGSVDYWSAMQEEVQLPAVAADVVLPNVVVSGFTGSVKRAVLIFTYEAKENTNANANKLSGAQYIQVRKSGGTWTNAIALADDLFGLAASTREGGGAIIGAVNLSAVVDGDGTYNVQWASALCDVANLNFNDIQVGLRIW